MPSPSKIRPQGPDTDEDNSDADLEDFAAIDDVPDALTDEEEAEERQQRLRSRHKSRRTDAGSEVQLDRLLSETDGLADLITTYQPSRHERGWLLSSLRDFYEQGLISDVQAAVKGGKEASVYRCQTAPDAEATVGTALVAAKVYRPRAFRNLRNDARYREGRPVLTAEGRAVKNSDTRIMKALGKKTGFGAQIQHTSWLMYEFTTLATLHQAGAAVPKPFAAAENAILMEYIGDESRAAPSLIETRLTPGQAQECFLEVRRNLSLLLAHGWIHGDLSAFNILYWEGKTTLIDFPQVVQKETNPDAEEIFYRDVARVCESFASYGIAPRPEKLAADLWRAAEKTTAQMPIF